MYYSPGDFIIETKTKVISRIITINLTEKNGYEFVIVPVEMQMHKANTITGQQTTNYTKL